MQLAETKTSQGSKYKQTWGQIADSNFLFITVAQTDILGYTGIDGTLSVSDTSCPQQTCCVSDLTRDVT